VDKTDSVYVWLNSLPIPRPLTWRGDIYRRRYWYGFLCLLLLVLLVGVPHYYGLHQMQDEPTVEKLKPNQIPVALGALIVVSYVTFVLLLFKQYDDIKWLGQRGAITEANILAVYRSQRKLFVDYRFWDAEGREREREAVIDVDDSRPIPELKAGMIVPILFDQHKPEKRNYLWAEISSFLTERKRGKDEVLD
jgi:hypothetical protein